MSIPRRIRLDLMTPEERACLDAIWAIERMPHAHPLLTEAQMLIGKAQSRLADWVDRDDPEQARFVGFPRDVPDPMAAAHSAVGEAVYARVALLMDAEPGTPAAAELEALANLVTRAEAALSDQNAGSEAAGEAPGGPQ